MSSANEYNKAFESKAGVIAISFLIVLVLFAIFSSTKPGKKVMGGGVGTAHKPVELEDLREQGRANHRKLTIKNGQKLVVF